MNPFLVLALLSPFVGAAVVPFTRRHDRRRAVVIAAVVAALVGLVGASRAGTSTSAGWQIDRVGGLLASSALLLGLGVVLYATRQFATERRGGAIVGASLATLGCVVATDLAATPGSLLASWVLTSVSTVSLLRASSPTTRPGRLAARTFAAGDGLLIVAAVVVLARPHATSVWGPWHQHPGVSGGTLLLAAASVAAALRAGFTGRRSWVTETINAPTSTSALLHAGVVNAGALLLWRVHEFAGQSALVNAALAAACVIVLVVLGPRINTRVDLKGQLAVSTVSQMAFMLLAMAVGFPVLAVTHLVGHGLYKAYRFMSAGAAIEQRARRRRRAAQGRTLGLTTRTLGALALVLVALGVGAVSGLDGRAALGVVAPAALAVWWTRSRTPVRGASVVWVVISVSLAAYGVVVGGVAHVLTPTVPQLPSGPWWTLGGVVVALAVTALLRRRPRSAPAPVVAPPSPVLLAEVAVVG